MLLTPDNGFAGFVDASRAKPWIAAVCGAALGGGFELTLACDMIVASEDATFGLPEVKRGLFAGGHLVLIRQLQAVDGAQDFLKVAAGRRRIGERQPQLLGRIDHQHGADRVRVRSIGVDEVENIGDLAVTPADWKPGDDVIIVPSITNEAARSLFPNGWTEHKPCLRTVAQPDKESAVPA